MFNDTTLYWQGYFSSSLTLFAYKWCLGDWLPLQIFSLKWGDIIWFFTGRKKMFVHLERLEKERLSLNEMDCLTWFEKWAGASLRMQDSLFLGWKVGLVWEERKAPGSVLWALQWEWGRKGNQPTFPWALSHVDSGELHVWVIHVNIWRFLKRFFWHVRCLLTRLLPRKYLRCQKLLSYSDITLKFRSSSS